MEEALRIIVAKSPMAGSMAMQTLQAIKAKSPVLQDRYNRTVQTALNDSQADFTPEERVLIASHIGGNDSLKAFDVRVRVTAEEKDRIQQMAAVEDMTVSEFIRDRIGL
jgi:hypothetical protein